MKIKNFLTEKFATAMVELGIPSDCPPSIALSSRPEFGDYQVNGAMKAAKKMGRTKSKQKTGRKVFHHLKMMIQLQSDPSKNCPRRVQSGPFVQNLLLFPGNPRD